MTLKLPNFRDRRYASKVVPILSFAPEPYAPIRDIKVVLEETANGFLATLYDANLGSCGETETEALDGLKDVIIHAFEFLEKQERLGPAPTRQLAVLRSLISRT